MFPLLSLERIAGIIKADPSMSGIVKDDPSMSVSFFGETTKN